jgi:predicted dehydrogenase
MVYRAALIGCGKIGSEFADDPLMKGDVLTHAEAYTRCAETTLAAVCDVDPGRLARCGQRWGVEARYQSVQALMEAERPDLVSVCTPDASHYQVVRQVLTSQHVPRGVLCEKPLATSPERARELVELAHQKGVVLAVAYMRRFADNMRVLKTFLLDGKLGEVQAVNGWYTKGTLHNGTHWFDLLRFLVGEVIWVLGLDTLKEAGADPTLDVLLGLENGALASLRAASAQHYTIFEMEIFGTVGRVRLIDSCFQIELALAAPSPRYSGYVELAPALVNFGERKNLMLHAVEALAHCVRTGDRLACSGEDGLTALEIGWAAHESARLNQKVVLHG